jgi:formylglycine-generating enzyme required for sulfatase activity
MKYPSIEQYKDSIRLANHTLKTLTGYEPVFRNDGELWFSSGNFAVVFKLKHKVTGKEIALKCFTRHQESRKQNFQKISECLKDYPSDYMVGYQYLEEELWVETGHGEDTEVSVLAMDWVNGSTLGEYVKLCCQNGDDLALNMLLSEFKWLFFWLLSQPFAHGDLKPDNIIVNPRGKPIILDYDGMFVPSMKGQPALEMGSPVYRHPNRSLNEFNKRIDDFAIIILLFELRILSLKPDKYLKSSGESLCLSLNDITASSMTQLSSNLELNPRLTETFFWNGLVQEFEKILSIRSDSSSILNTILYKNLKIDATNRNSQGFKATPNHILPQMVPVSKGQFMMGDIMNDNLYKDEKPLHTITIEGFYLASTAVTFREYDLFCDAIRIAKPKDEGWGRGFRPVINVTWIDAIMYCNWLSEIKGYKKVYEIIVNHVNINMSANGFRLPTESEWEYASRSQGKNVRFGHGLDTIDDFDINCDFYNSPRNYDFYTKGSYKGRTVPVSTYPPNELGLYEMSGNIWEWCNDWYREYKPFYSGTNQGTERVIRGGSWDDFPWDCRTSVRFKLSPFEMNSDVGFRLARKM